MVKDDLVFVWFYFTETLRTASSVLELIDTSTLSSQELVPVGFRSTALVNTVWDTQNIFILKNSAEF